MPKVVHDAVKKMQKKGMPEEKAWPIATAAMQKAGKIKKKGRKNRSKASKPY